MPTQNSANNLNFTGVFGCVNLTGVKHINISVNNSSAATTDLYTCPSGKRCWIAYINGLTVSGSCNCQQQIKVSGTYYPVSETRSLNTSGWILSTQPNIILEAGEIFAVTTGAGANIWFTAIEFDAICPLKTKKVLALANGDNTIYTVPTGFNAFIMDRSGLFDGTSLCGGIYNNTAGALNYTTYAIKSGQTKAARYNCQLATSIAATSRDSMGTVPAGLNAGDFILLNTSGAGAQTAWVNVVEVPA